MYELYLSYKGSDINKKMIKFLNDNLYSMNKSNMVFKFILITDENKKMYNDKNINVFPMLINNNTKIVGLEKIADYLKQSVIKNNKKTNVKTDDERVDDFWKQTMGSCKKDENGVFKFDDDEETDDINKDLTHKIQKAFENRNKIDDDTSKQKGKTPAPYKPKEKENNMDETPSQTLRNMEEHNVDDDLMAKYFENQEESL